MKLAIYVTGEWDDDSSASFSFLTIGPYQATIRKRLHHCQVTGHAYREFGKCECGWNATGWSHTWPAKHREHAEEVKKKLFENS